MVQKEREDRAALDRFYVRTGQRPAPGEPEDVVAVWEYASRPEATFAIGVLTAKGVARYEYKQAAQAQPAGDARCDAPARRPQRGELCRRRLRVARRRPRIRRVVGEGGLLASANIDEVLLEGARVPRGDVKAIYTFVGHDYVMRGIPVERADGALLPLVSEGDAIAEADPTYGRNELRVASESGQSTTSQWLLAGSNGELAAYLRWPETVRDIPRHIRGLVESQQQHRMG